MVKWRFSGPNDTEAGWSEPFADRERAEAWLGEAWVDLAGRGVEHVELTDGATGAVLYRMSLADG